MCAQEHWRRGFRLGQAGPQVADTEMEDHMEESTVEAPPVQHLSEVSVGPGSQDMVQIYMGNDDLE